MPIVNLHIDQYSRDICGPIDGISFTLNLADKIRWTWIQVFRFLDEEQISFFNVWDGDRKKCDPFVLVFVGVYLDFYLPFKTTKLFAHVLALK